MKKFTFKINAPTGRFRSFSSTFCDIKLNGIVVGNIIEIKSIPCTFRIGFMVTKKDIMEDKNPNCEWKWIWIKHKPHTIQDAKDFVTKYSKEIQEQYSLHIRNEE
jgi:hypothetical protein